MACLNCMLQSLFHARLRLLRSALPLIDQPERDEGLAGQIEPSRGARLLGDRLKQLECLLRLAQDLEYDGAPQP
jgi:hypothetical protein